MDDDSLRNRLQLADETIGILRSSNAQLDRNLNGLKSDFSVLESLMIESGQTLQRLQEMYHKEKEMNSVLTASLHKMESNNKELKELYEFEVLKNKELSISKSKEPQQLTLIEAENESKTSEIIVHHVAASSAMTNKSQKSAKLHEYHLNIRDSLRDIAESLCDELVRVEEDMLALEPLLRLGQQDEAEKQSASSSASKHHNRAKSNRMKRSAGPDFLFGSPSSRLPVKSSEGIVDEEAEGRVGEDEEEDENEDDDEDEGDDEEKEEYGRQDDEEEEEEEEEEERCRGLYKQFGRKNEYDHEDDEEGGRGRRRRNDREGGGGGREKSDFDDEIELDNLEEFLELEMESEREEMEGEREYEGGVDDDDMDIKYNEEDDEEELEEINLLPPHRRKSL